MKINANQKKTEQISQRARESMLTTWKFMTTIVAIVALAAGFEQFAYLFFGFRFIAAMESFSLKRWSLRLDPTPGTYIFDPPLMFEEVKTNFDAVADAVQDLERQVDDADWPTTLDDTGKKKRRIE